METPDTEFVPPVEMVIADTVLTVYRRWRKWAEHEDINQDLWVFYLENQSQTDADLVSPESREAVCRRFIKRAERFCRREKADQCGYSLEDEVTYSRDAIENLIPAALMDDVDAPLRQFEDKTSTGRDERFLEYETAVVDIRCAVDTLDEADRVMLWETFVDEMTWLEIGRKRGLTEDAARKRVSRIVSKLGKTLNYPAVG